MFDQIQKGPSYRHDAYNAILRLINKGQVEVATKILKTFNKPTEEQFYQGAFFIKQLVKVKKSPENIVQICRTLKEDGVIPNALLIALETSMQLGDVELSQQLLKELHKNGIEIRQHYFWPLLAQKGKENDEEGLLQVLRSMSNEGIIPSRETLQNYVIPYLKGNTDPQNIVVKLQIANVPPMVSLKSVIMELLQMGNIKEAAKLAQQHKIRGNTFIKEQLCTAFAKTKDIDSFATILHVTSTNSEIAETDEPISQEDGTITVERNTIDTDYIVFRAIQGTFHIIIQT